MECGVLPEQRTATHIINTPIHNEHKLFGLAVSLHGRSHGHWDGLKLALDIAKHILKGRAAGDVGVTPQMQRQPPTHPCLHVDWRTLRVWARHHVLLSCRKWRAGRTTTCRPAKTSDPGLMGLTDYKEGGSEALRQVNLSTAS